MQKTDGFSYVNNNHVSEIDFGGFLSSFGNGMLLENNRFNHYI